MAANKSFWTKTILHNILADAIDLIPHAKHGSVFIFNNNFFEMVAAIGYPLEKFKGVFLHYTEFLQGVDLHYNEDTYIKVYTNIFESDKELMSKSDSLQVFDDYGRIDEIKCILSIALYKDDTIFALVALDNYDNYDAFSDEDIETAKVFAKNISNNLNQIDKTIIAERASDTYEMLLGLIAHELNNITQGLNMGTQLLFNKLTEDNKLDSIKSRLNELLLRQKVISHRSRIILKSGRGRDNLQSIYLSDISKEWLEINRKLNPGIKINFQTKVKKGKIKANLLIKEVFNNLLSNSIKYKKKNQTLKIEISLLQLKQQEKVPKPFIKSPNYYLIKFRDNGIGMSDKLKESLFRPFKRGGRGTKGVPGLGLGLAIVRSIIESYEGFIWVEDSKLGKSNSGVTFWIGIPMNET